MILSTGDQIVVIAAIKVSRPLDASRQSHLLIQVILDGCERICVAAIEIIE